MLKLILCTVYTLILLTGVIYTAVCPYIEINYIADQNLFKWHCNVQLYLQN